MLLIINSDSEKIFDTFVEQGGKTSHCVNNQNKGMAWGILDPYSSESVHPWIIWD